MGRGKVQLKRIEDKISRQVTFSKRKGGLMKKANELAVLCDVEVALLIFSDRGRLYEFCSTESLEEILERYRIHAEEEAAVRKRAEQEKHGVVDQKEKQSQELQLFPKLRSNHGIEMNLAECTDLQTSGNPLQMIQRQLDIQNIELKNMTELTQLEKDMEAILRQIRFRKTQLMMDAAKAVHEEICFNGPANALLAGTLKHNIEQKNMTELTQLERELDVTLRQIIFRKNSPCDPCLMHWCAICQEHREMKNHPSNNAAVAMTIVMLDYMTHRSHLSCQLLSTSRDHADTSPSTACTAKPHRVNDHGVAEDLHDSTYPALTSVNDAAKERRSLPLLPDNEDLYSQGNI